MGSNEEDRFAEHLQSPTPDDQREALDGLQYFEPDLAYRFEEPLHEHAEKEAVTVETTTDGERTYLR